MKIGLGIITCDRPDFFKVCRASIPTHKLDEIIVVNDGIQPVEQYPGDEIRWTAGRRGVAISKNLALSHLLDTDCDYIFLIEDDMKILNENIFDEYISLSKETNIEHFNFGYHGPANKAGIPKGKPQPKLKVQLPSGKYLALNEHCVGAFSMYTRNSLMVCGLMDVAFYNAFEHVEHSYRLAQKGYSTPYWWWADLANSFEYITEQACSTENSSITQTPSNIEAAIYEFRRKHGYAPFAWGDFTPVPLTPVEEVLQFLRNKYTTK